MLKIDEKLHLKPRNSSPKGGLHVQADTQNVTPLNGPPESCTIPEKVLSKLSNYGANRFRTHSTEDHVQGTQYNVRMSQSLSGPYRTHDATNGLFRVG